MYIYIFSYEIITLSPVLKCHIKFVWFYTDGLRNYHIKNFTEVYKIMLFILSSVGKRQTILHPSSLSLYWLKDYLIVLLLFSPTCLRIPVFSKKHTCLFLVRTLSFPRSTSHSSWILASSFVSSSSCCCLSLNNDYSENSEPLIFTPHVGTWSSARTCNDYENSSQSSSYHM